MTCRTCDCADKAADTDEWVTFAKRPVEPLTSWSHHDIPELAAEKVSEVERLTAELAEVKRTYTPCDLDLLTERDALAAKVARVESLAGQWARLAGTAINPNSREWLQACAATLRECLSGWPEMSAVLAGSDADTGAEEAGHKCEPYYSRSECGQCGWQEQWCATCSRQMCGCATGATDQDAMGADQ